MEEEGLRSSRYLARVLQLDDEGRAFVEFPAFFADETNDKLLTDWISCRQLWPPPPPAPPDFFERLSIGEPLEVYHEDGWWEVTLQRTRQAQSGRMTYQVTSSFYNTERWANADRLRPRWRFMRDTEKEPELEFWKADAPDGLVVWEDSGLLLPTLPEASGLATASGSVVPGQVAQEGEPWDVEAINESAHGNAQGEAGDAGPAGEAGAAVGADGGMGGTMGSRDDDGEGGEVEVEVEEEAQDDYYDDDEDDHVELLEAAGGSVNVDGAGGGVMMAGERARLQAQIQALHHLALQYRARVCEIRDAAQRIFPLAQAAVLNAGGTLEQPECFTRFLPPLPRFPTDPPSGQET